MSEGTSFTPRSYQTTIADKAMRQNTIIFLPTGSGKTFIAVLAIKRFLSRESRSFEEGGKLCVFVVNAVVLVDQQARVLERHLPISKAGRYSGSLNVDSWSKEKWQEEFRKHSVLVMTAEILRIILQHCFLPPSRLSIIVFDECHAAVGDNPMNMIMRLILDCKERPRLIGLTATLLNGNAETTTKASQGVENLLKTFDAKIGYVMNEEVKCFSTKPKEEIIGYDDYVELSDEVKAASKELKKGKLLSSVFAHDPKYNPTLKDMKKIQAKVFKLLGDIEVQFENLGMFGGSKAALYGIQLLEFMKICEKPFSLIVQITHAINTLTSVRAAIEQRMSSYPEERRPYSCSSFKVKTLLDLIQERKDEEKEGNFHCLILVERKNTAKILCTVLKHVASLPDFSFIKPVFLVGGSGSSDPFPYNNEEIARLSKTAIESFRNDEANVLISTDVMEEGIDVPFCNCVIKFDKISSYKSYLQSKGRARSQDSKYFVLVKKNDLEEEKNRLELYNMVEDYLWSVVRDPNIVNEMDLNCEPYELDLNDTYKTKTGAVLMTTNAISVLNKYCSLLKYDRYTDCTLDWKEDRSGKEKDQVCVAKLSLPEVAPTQLTVESDAKSNMRRAKQNAAYKMCMELYKLGELDDDLVPVPSIRKFEADPKWWSNWDITDDIAGDAVKKIGTSKRQSSYLYRIPSCLVDCHPTNDQTCYLHVIAINPKGDEPPTDRKYAVIYEQLKKEASYAILSSKKMPKVCSFPAFMSVAHLSVEIVPNYKEVSLTSEELSKLTSFNEAFFTRITCCTNSSADLKGGGKDYLVVPTKTNNLDVFIDWDEVDASSSLDQDKPSEAKRRKLNVCAETYHGTIVKPWYRGCGDKVYMVTKVCTDLNGLSVFPGLTKSYAERFTAVYEVNIYSPQLPLLEVKSISSRVNCLVKGRDARHRFSTFDEHFLPELCTHLPLSGTLWVKASMMPSILYRVERLLIAEEMLHSIVSQSNLGQVEIAKDFQWKPLQEEEVIEKVETKRHPKTVEEEKKRKEYPLFQNIEEQDTNYLMSYYSLLSLKPTIALDNDTYEYETVPKVLVPRQSLLRSSGAQDGLQLREIFTALTAPSAEDVVNYERLETLGDSFLKVAVSLFLYEACPLKHEGLLTDLKGRLLGNRNLFCCALKKKLPEFMSVSNLAQSTHWCPPNFTTPLKKQSAGNEEGNATHNGEAHEFVVTFSDSSKPKHSTLDDVVNKSSSKYFFGTQSIKDKTVADCVEALIGATLMNCGWEGAMDILVWLEILPGNVERPNKTSVPVKRLLENGFKESSIASSNSETLPVEVRNIQELIGYNFNDPEILKQALTHPSFDPKNSYERLEFVGDAVLDFLITTYIYENCGLLTPGQLTDLRSALVNNITFAALTVKYGLNRFMLANSPKLLQVVDVFIKGRKESNHTIDNDVLILFEEGEIRISEAITIPKSLADLFEALAGAIFFDSDRDLNAVWNVFYPLMHDVIQSFCQNVPMEPVRALYEAYPGVKFEYNRDEKHLKMIATCSVVVEGQMRKFHGYGENRKMAKRAAAKFALFSLKKGARGRSF